MASHFISRRWLWLLKTDYKYEKKQIIAKDMVGLLVGDSKNDSLTKIKTY